MADSSEFKLKKVALTNISGSAWRIHLCHEKGEWQRQGLSLPSSSLTRGEKAGARNLGVAWIILRMAFLNNPWLFKKHTHWFVWNNHSSYRIHYNCARWHRRSISLFFQYADCLQSLSVSVTGHGTCPYFQLFQHHLHCDHFSPI